MTSGVERATGRNREQWFAVLDEWSAPGRPYREIADELVTVHGVSAWWAQKLIVEYEQARGIREPGARPDGTFTAGASRTVAAPADAVHAAFTDEVVLRQWLPGTALRERTSRPGRSGRYDLDDGTRLSVTLDATGPEKTRVAVEQGRIPDASAAAEARTAWKARLARLKRHLESSSGKSDSPGHRT